MRKLYSRHDSFLSDYVDERNLSVPSPVFKVRTSSNPKEPDTNSLSSSDFAAGLREATGEGLDGESQPITYGGVTSTQKIISESPINHNIRGYFIVHC